MVQAVKIGAGRISAAAKGEWDTKLSLVQHSYRARRMNDGPSPYFLMFGTKVLFPRVEAMLKLGVEGDQ